MADFKNQDYDFLILDVSHHAITPFTRTIRDESLSMMIRVCWGPIFLRDFWAPCSNSTVYEVILNQVPSSCFGTAVYHWGWRLRLQKRTSLRDNHLQCIDPSSNRIIPFMESRRDDYMYRWIDWKACSSFFGQVPRIPRNISEKRRCSSE